LNLHLLENHLRSLPSNYHLHCNKTCQKLHIFNYQLNCLCIPLCNFQCALCISTLQFPLCISILQFALCISAMQFPLCISTIQFPLCDFHYTFPLCNFHLISFTMHFHFAISIMQFSLCISIGPWSFKLQVKILWTNIKNNSKFYGKFIKQKIFCPHPSYSH
jgi:hypothetical protein